MKHTPGPWSVEPEHNDLVIYPTPRDLNGGPVAIIHCYRGTAEANARLIAAAPEMASELAKAADTFADLRRLNTMLRKMALAEACGISEDSIRDLLAKIDGAA